MCNYAVTFSVTRRLRMVRKIIVMLVILLTVLSCAAGNKVEPEVSYPGVWGEILEDAKWAQNAHNMQSWKLDVVSESKIVGSLDKGRVLPETDPISRQLILSLGALSEVARVSAMERGKELVIEWIGPDAWNKEITEDVPLFSWTLIDTEKSETRDYDFVDAISTATVKYAVDGMDFSKDEAEKLINRYSDDKVTFTFHYDDSEVEKLKELSMEAFKVEMENEPTLMESFDNTHYGKKARKETPYGITLLSNFPKNKIGFIDFFTTLFPGSPKSYTKQSVKMFNKAVEPSTVLISMKTKGNSPKDQFNSGRNMQGFWLEILSRGGSLLPLSQGLQEYKEVESYYEQFHNLIADKDETIQMLWALGKPVDGEFYRSPRFQVADFVINQ